MAILLPSVPGIRTAEPELLDFGAVQQGAQGGAAQRLNRIGNRFAIAVELPPMKTEPTGRIYVSRALDALTQGAIYPFPQPRLVIGDPGSPVVNGAGQLGSVLNMRGFVPGYVIREGQFFSIIVAGRRYLHKSASPDTTVAVDGTVTIAITPMLRASPADGAVCEFAQPHIEGLLSGDARKWRLLLEPYTSFTFSISEMM